MWEWSHSREKVPICLVPSSDSSLFLWDLPEASCITGQFPVTSVFFLNTIACRSMRESRKTDLVSQKLLLIVKATVLRHVKGHFVFVEYLHSPQRHMNQMGETHPDEVDGTQWTIAKITYHGLNGFLQHVEKKKGNPAESAEIMYPELGNSKLSLRICVLKMSFP